MTLRVLVAHETDTIRDAALRVVRDAGYEAVGVAEGESARTLLFAKPYPVALVVDVGLPKRLGYELVEDIRERGLPTRVVLVASVYSKTAYKRRPTSLYGADDYVEQHHIFDQLAPKLAKLITSPGAPHAPEPRDVHGPLTPAERAEADRVKSAGERRLAFRFASREDGIERARRLARLIVADVVLYNGAAVEDGLTNGDLATRIAPDLAAGRELFALRVPPELVDEEDYIGAALDEFVRTREQGRT